MPYMDPWVLLMTFFLHPTLRGECGSAGSAVVQVPNWSKHLASFPKCLGSPAKLRKFVVVGGDFLGWWFGFLGSLGIVTYGYPQNAKPLTQITNLPLVDCIMVNHHEQLSFGRICFILFIFVFFYFVESLPLLREMIQFDKHVFQMGWNMQL